jgi:hypothetical protein
MIAGASASAIRDVVWTLRRVILGPNKFLASNFQIIATQSRNNKQQQHQDNGGR